MNVNYWTQTLLMLLCSAVCLVRTMRPFEYCLMFHGSCQSSCDSEPDTFPLLGFNWCFGGNTCCIKVIRPDTTTSTTTSTTTTSTSTTTPTTTTPTPSTTTASTTTTTTTTTTPTTTTTTPATTSTLTSTTTTTPGTTTSYRTTPRTTSTTTVSTSTSQPTTTSTTTASTTTSTIAPLPRCGVSIRGRAPSSRIIGGREAEKCKLPWVVHIALPMGPCGGTLLDDRHILTAAHCFNNMGAFTPEVTIGEYNRSEEAPTEKFSTRDYRIIVHPMYDHISYFYDIAILRLNTRIDYNQYRCVQQICLPTSQMTFASGTPCVVAGWGVTEPEYDVFNPPTPQTLMKVELPIVDEALCVRKFGKYYNSTIQTCAGQLEGSKDSCDGDSGGPLMCHSGTGGEFYIAGIVSSGAGCAQPQTPAIYTDVIAFLPWIQSIMGS